jgi:hypothetical protein
MLGRVRQPGDSTPPACGSHPLSTGRLALIFAACALCWPSPRAAAQDKPPYLFLEPTEYTDVIDAFDGPDDPIDFNVQLSFVRSQDSASILRERNPAGAFAVDTLHVANYRSVRSALVLGAEIGLYKDLMLYGQIPLVFSDTRDLRLPNSARCESPACRQRARTVASVLNDAPPDAADPSPLFQPVPLAAARTRSGVPAVDVGVAWGITNQYRTPGLPTWVVLAEGRFSVSTAMKPCLAGSSCDPGKSRGTTRLLLGTRWSYRYRIIEPYVGLDHAFEWAAGADQAFDPSSAGVFVDDTGLPSVTGMTLGGTIVPWEHRGRFQQFSIDLRGRAEYVSSGRDYTPLFDVLGASANPALKEPFHTDNGKQIGFNGLTHVDAYARLVLDIALAMQAARYVRFRVDLVLSHMTEHLLSGAAPCTSAARDSDGDGSDACGNKQPNALYRPVIDQPGQRFALSDQLSYSLSASATAQF